MKNGRQQEPVGRAGNADRDTCLNILLVGEEAAGIQVLRMLAASPHRIVGVASSPGSNSQVATLWNVAGKMGLVQFPAQQIRQPDFSAQLIDMQVDLILNVHSLFILPAAVIQACRIGAFNMHPGPLPEYAGLNVPSWAIYRGETEHAVTIHQMTSQVDAGTIAYAERFPIAAGETGMTLMLKCVRAGIPLIKRLLEAASQGIEQIPHWEQDLSHRQFFSGKAPNHGELCWHRSAREIVNHVRAADYSPFPSPWGHPVNFLNDRKYGVVRARTTSEISDAEPGTVGQPVDRGVYVAAKDNWVLVETMILDGQPVSAQEVLGAGDRLKETLCQRGI